MNEWIKKSIELANNKNYLDRLFYIYPVEFGDNKIIPKNIKKEIIKAFKIKNEADLIRALLKLSRFPIDDPYVASLRSHPSLFKNNPKTIKRIGDKLLKLGPKMVLDMSGKPSSATRRLGHTFKQWLPTLKYPFLEDEKFKDHKGIAFLLGSDSRLKNFAKKELMIRNLKKGIDFILRVNNKFILGEAKFLTTSGGTQNNQFNGAIDVAKIKKNNVIGIAVLDGIVWFESNIQMHRAIKKFRGMAISALLLKEFIESL